LNIFTHGKGLPVGDFNSVKNQQFHAAPSSGEESELELTA